ncbi:ABC transporter substrate-binding protein [Aestuariicoccus sp. MJ-SS9]|uniref:ABC transporter substrate-binding protein n=1 Tax=Aestuariicoccus sp. MJ-SS9 TaxID=3079855 RepID=UPI00290641B7|nr:ABC transporter substrate-binding protein [Aestuariicoccus sp. MJ-SS9]MDU8913410.1 ABC transporter substrate-binding protein [Aestuariicoccus sp. MJ-SS9]
MKNLRSLLRGCVCALALASVSATGVMAEEVLKFRGAGKLDLLDPIWTSNFAVRDHGFLVYETLFAPDADYNPQPMMIDTWSVSEDGKTYTFTLREGLLFHDGSTVDTGDVIASLSRWMEKDSSGQIIAARLQSMDAVDDLSFTMTLSDPLAMLIPALGKVSSNVPFIMPEEIAQTPSDEQITSPIGSGPYVFQLDEWQPGVQAVYTPFDGYQPRSEPRSGLAGEKIAHFDRIERLFFADELTAANALMTGEIDYIPLLSPDTVQILQGNPEVEVAVKNPLGKSVQIVMNHLQPPFDDVRIRQAVQLALGQSDYLIGMYGDQTQFYQECPALFMCGTPLESDVNSERVMAKDPEAAKALLEEAGYDGTPVTILHAMDINDQRIGGTITVQSLQNAGFVVDEVVTDWATVAQRRANKGPVSEGGWNIFQTGWTGDAMMSPITNVYVTGACEDAWYGWHCDEQIQELRSAFVDAQTEEERLSVAEAIQERAFEIVSVVIMGQFVDPAAWRSDLKGMEEFPIFTNLWGVTRE